MKKFKINTLKASEIILVLLIWVVIIIIPVFNNDGFNWGQIFRPITIPLFIVFLINRFILVPYLFVNKNRLLYFGSIIGVIILTTFSSYAIDNKHFDPRNGFHQSPPPKTQGRVAKPPFKKPIKPINPISHLIIFSILIVGFDTGLMTSFRLAKTEKENERLEKENVQNQLAFLRSQISPHFFMNTLNNIHAQIDINMEDAKDSIIRLSKLMRHILYEADTDKISLSKEINFIENYVSLMKMRYTDNLDIKLQLPTVIPESSIPPMILISFIENAFKHGISYATKSFIHISIDIGYGWLNYKVINSNHSNYKDNIDESGIGLSNTIKRLKLIYDKEYKIDIINAKDKYTVTLNIPL